MPTKIIQSKNSKFDSVKFESTETINYILVLFNAILSIALIYYRSIRQIDPKFTKLLMILIWAYIIHIKLFNFH